MKTKIMGILNVTPDSFSDGGKYYDNKNHLDITLKHVEEMIKDGASVIDVGGESTRPGFSVVPKEEEIERVIPVIEAIKKNFNTEISVDTYKAEVAMEACKAGASIINDIGMGMLDENMFKTVAQTGLKYVLMHNKENYSSLIDDMKEAIEKARTAGILDSNLILDPGIGFNKTYEDNIREFKNMTHLKALGYPILIGVSNKSMIGNALELPIGDRLEGTIATSVMATMWGADYIRVHDVRANARAIKMTEKVLY